MQKHTKIVATIGPSCGDTKTLITMFEAGMNVGRLNFSHGNHPEHLDRLMQFRSAAASTSVNSAILQDLGGPKIRIGDFENGEVEIIPGNEFIITTDECVGDANRVSLTYKDLPAHVKQGSRILLNDGKNELKVTKVSGNDIHTEIIVGGKIKSRRGVNIPGAYLPIRSLTDKDRADVVFGINNEADFVALSFVRTASDIADLREILNASNSKARIISKIETQEATENLEEIIEATDGIMVARGDLAVEVPAYDVPLIQKHLVSRCRELGKTVIVATQMLESMTDCPTPTRAEVSDVANAVLDGTDAVMLSAESALGKYPIETIRTMSSIARAAEMSGLHIGYNSLANSNSTTDTVTEAVMHAAARSHAKAIVAMTDTGFTARMIARFRLPQDILVMTPHANIQRQLALSYGCDAVINCDYTSIDAVVEYARAQLIKRQIATTGDKFIISAGIPFGISGNTNTMMIQTV